ncbi:MAG: ester cyclase [Methanotrichaceae archaeon]|nr:ester cyclase [Methanotrichaceae archaeon]
MLRNAFPDLHMRIEDIVAEGDMVAVRYTMQGTFKGKLRNMAPTGNQFKMSSALFMRYKDGKAVETRELYDQLTLFQQLGVNPAKG